MLKSDKYILSKHGTFVGFGYLCNGMFMLNLSVPFGNETTCIVSTSNILNDSKLWHARLGHVNYKRLKEMSKMSLIPAFDINIEKCNTCKLTKITRKPFKNVTGKTKY